MEKIRETAFFCVGRAVMFSTLAVMLVMLSFAFDPVAALKAGGTMGLALSAILLWFAQTAHRRKPKDTETWLLLKDDARPAGEHGAKLFASVMQDGSYVVVSCCCTHGLLKMRQRALNVTRFGERFCKVIATGLVRRLSHECLLQQRQRLCDPSL